MTARKRDDDKIVIKSDIGVAAEFTTTGSKTLRGGKKAREIVGPILDAIKRARREQSRPNGLQVELESNIPYGIGLGSSAASCVATIAAVDSLYDSHNKNWICDRAVESERIIHRYSSGADCHVSTFGGVMRYSKDEGYKMIKTRKQSRLVVCSTGIVHSTGSMVERVREFKEANPERYILLSKRASEVCSNALRALESGNIEALGQLMTKNQELLRQIGVSHKRAEALVRLALKAGALGAKITGAGGGGAIIALARSKKDSTKIAAAISKEGYDAMEVQIDSLGLLLPGES